ncbi:MAG: CoA-binding protein [Deltaproteobacteria bacterium]|nr:CoA-binding protein [Deltaproteobacteria bacterium]
MSDARENEGAPGAACPVPDRSADARVREWLGRPRVVAVVGMSPDPARPSYDVGLYLRERGFTVIPVHPKATEIAGLRVERDLGAIPAAAGVEIVDIFVAPERTLPIVEQAARIGAKVVWFQPGAEHPAAEMRARELGLEVFSGTCTKAEHRRLFGPG